MFGTSETAVAVVLEKRGCGRGRGRGRGTWRIPTVDSDLVTSIIELISASGT